MDSKPVEDDVGAQRTLRETHDRQVPAELIQQLHAADRRLDELRRQLEATMTDADYGHAARREKVAGDLRAAEREIEDVSRRIREASPPQAQA